MSEKPSNNQTEQTIDGLLEQFAETYSPLADGANLTAVEKEALADRRQWAQRVQSKKSFYGGKNAKRSETVANAHDMTFRREKEVADLALSPVRWHRVLVGKAPDLCILIKRTVQKIAALVAAMEEPEDAVKDYVGYFRMKIRAAETGMQRVLRSPAGVACYKVVAEGPAKTIGEAASDLAALTSGEMPGRVAAWAAEMEKQAERLAA